MQNITKYILFLFTSFIMICSVYADSLVEKVTVQNPYTVAYINLNKIYNSSLFKYTNEKLKDAGSNSVNQSDLYKKIIKTLKKHNLQESDFTEFASTVGLKNPNITSVDNVKKRDINFAFGFFGFGASGFLTSVLGTCDLYGTIAVVILSGLLSK